MEEKQQYIRNFSPKDEIDCFFLVKNLNLVEGRDGRPYLNVILTDASGEMEARMWANPDKVVRHVSKGDIVRVEGRVNLYQNRKQLLISRMERLDAEAVNLAGLTATAKISPEEMMESLLAIVEEKTDDRYIRELLLLILKDSEIYRRLLTWPAGKTIHHSYQSGLLEHILSCARLGLSLSAHYEVNHNYVLAGCIVHDLCKVFELSELPSTEYTFEGKMVGHLVGGVELIEEFSRKIPGFPLDQKIHLKHILLSHHGEYAYGSPKIPQTLEAMLVHLIDLMDSRMNSMQMVRDNDQGESDWTNYIKHLDRMVFRPELPRYPIVTKAPKVTAPLTQSQPAATGQLKQSLGKILEGVKINPEES